MTKSLQDKLYNDLKDGAQVGQDFSLENGLLIYSGADTEKSLIKYKSKLDKIQSDFEKYYKREKSNSFYQTEPEIKSDLLNRFIGFDKYERFEITQDNLIQAIDSGLSNNKNKKIGNCSALSKLYSILGIRENFNLKMIFVEEPNSLLAHVFLKLISNQKEYPIETTNFEGFNLKLSYSNFQEFPIEKIFDLNLIECVSNFSMEKQEQYFKLIEKNDFFNLAAAYNNWGIMKFNHGEYNESKKLFNKAKSLNNKSCLYRLNLAEVQITLNEISKAKKNIGFIIQNGNFSAKEDATKLLTIIKEKEKYFAQIKYSPDVSCPEDFCGY